MHSYALAGIAIVVGMSFVNDSAETKQLVINIVKIGGMTYIVKNVINRVDTDKANMIGLAGVCMASNSMVGILNNSIQMVTPVVSVLGKVGGAIEGLGVMLDKLIRLADTVVFWN